MEYSPGTCNIDRTERKKRLVTGSAAFTNSLLLVAVMIIFPGLQLLYVPVLLLNFAGFLGFFQYRESFCAGLALRKKYSINGEESVVNEEEAARDRKKAAVILLKSVVSALVLTLLVYSGLGYL